MKSVFITKINNKVYTVYVDKKVFTFKCHKTEQTFVKNYMQGLELIKQSK